MKTVMASAGGGDLQATMKTVMASAGCGDLLKEDVVDGRCYCWKASLLEGVEAMEVLDGAGDGYDADGGGNHHIAEVEL